MNFHAITLGFLLTVAPAALGQGGPLTNTASATAGLPAATLRHHTPKAARPQAPGFISLT